MPEPGVMIAMAISGAVAGTAVSSALKPLSDKAVEIIQTEIAKLWGVDEDLERLRHKLRLIESELEDAEQKQFTSKLVSEWLQRFRGAAYDAEDVLDELATAVAIRRQRSNKSSVRKLLSNWARNYDVAVRIRNIEQKLEKLAEEKKSLELKTRACKGDSEIVRDRDTSGALGWNSSGREKEKKAILRQLGVAALPHEPESCSNPHEPECSSNLERDGEKVSLISIVGMQGVGKTTLAQMVFNAEELENLFSFKKWICVSDDFDVLQLAAAITGKTDLSRSTLEDARLALNETLKDQKFLIVLDDVGCKEKRKWEEVWNVLCQAGKGGKVIVTTGSGTVETAIDNKKIERLSPLCVEQCWSIFERVAFENGNSEDYPTLREIGKKIVTERLKGIPLAAKLVGGFLGDNFDENVWRSVLEGSDIWNLVDQRNSIMPILQLSYQYLPAHLRRCFEYCAIFPKDYRFDIPELVRLWMAQGFIQPQGDMREEDIGRLYFNGLLRRSFFQQVGGGRYVMHDLIHDLAVSISGGECLRTGESTDLSLRVDSARVRHVSFPVRDYTRSSGPDRAAGWEHHGKFSKSRTFLNYIISLDGDMPKHAFGEMKFVRVLTLDLAGKAKQFPDAIGDLMHLRYLHVRVRNLGFSPSCWEWPCKILPGSASKSPCRILPESVCKLHNLQTLIVESEDTELPQGIRKLVNLRCLQAAVKLVDTLSGVHGLTPFWERTPPASSEWSSFVVGKTEKPRIGVLQNLGRLQGGLCLAGLENVKSGKHAKQANLKNMVDLRSLELVWNFNVTVEATSYPRDDTCDGNRSLDEETLNGFELPEKIEKLLIFGNSGGSPPGWMMQPARPFSGLVELWLVRCNNWEQLPPIGQLHRLKVLTIKSCPHIKSLPESGLPPSLKMLVITSCEGLTSLPPYLHTLSSLEHLSIGHCPLINALPDSGLPLSLKNLYIGGCPDLERRCQKDGADCHKVAHVHY